MKNMLPKIILSIFLLVIPFSVIADSGWVINPNGGGGGSIGGTISADQIAVGTGADTIGGSNNLLWDAINQILTIHGKQSQTRTITSEPGGFYFAILNQTTLDLPANTNENFIANYASLLLSGDHLYTGIQSGVLGQVTASQGTFTNITGVEGNVSSLSILGGTEMTALKGTVNAGSPVTTAYGLHIPAFTGGGLPGTSYGAKIDAPGIGTTRWTLGVGVGDSYIAGRLALGSGSPFTPTATLDVVGVVSGSTFIQPGTTAGITASVVQAQGQQPLTTEINEISIVANANDVVTAPSADAGRRFTVINNGANNLQIFPASGDNLGSGVDTSETLGAGSNVTYLAYDSTNWVIPN